MSRHFPLPPRARGKHRRAAGQRRRRASTPACAGQTCGTSEYSGGSNLYPRVRGANVSALVASLDAAPLPPRARGKQETPECLLRGFPSTPACAGQTCPVAQEDRLSGLYPRVRGANPALGRWTARLAPLPPRARGKPSGGLGYQPRPASTPACAGQTWRRSRCPPCAPLYPRVRGANHYGDRCTAIPVPLPPRARGKPLRNRTIQRDLTPAHLASHSVPTRWLPPERDTRRPRPLGRQQPHRRRP